MSAPPLELAVTPSLRLRALREADAGALVAAVDADRAVYAVLASDRNPTQPAHESPA